MPTTEDFDALTVNLMDQIATLLKVSRDLRAMETTFQNAPDLSGIEGKPYADKVTRFAVQAGCQFLKAVFAKEQKRTGALAKAQKAAAKAIPIAIEAAQALASMERNAMVAAGAKGNTIENLVVKPLQQLRDAWAIRSIDSVAPKQVRPPASASPAIAPQVE